MLTTVGWIFSVLTFLRYVGLRRTVLNEKMCMGVAGAGFVKAVLVEDAMFPSIKKPCINLLSGYR